jgi:hypothetical protein
LNQDKVALAGIVHTPQQAVLASFSYRNDDHSSLIFSAGASSAEPMIIGRGIALSGSTEASNILVHCHDRITVFKRDLLTGAIPVSLWKFV